MQHEVTTVVDCLHQAVAKWGDGIFLDFTGETYSFRETEQRAAQLAGGLSRRGVKFGDTVLVMLDNGPDYAFLWHAAAKLGAILAPINTDYRGEFLRHQATDSRATVMILEDHYLDRIEFLASELGGLERLVVRGAIREVAHPAAVEQLADCYAAERLEAPPTVRPEDPIAIFYTSGTTGPSKGCIVSHNYLCNLSRELAHFAGVRQGEVWWTCAPLFHLGANVTLFGALQVGAVASLYSRFSVSNFWTEIERARADVIAMVSIMLNLVATAPETEAEKRCYGKVRVVHGVPFSHALQDIYRNRFGVAVAGCINFAQTEVVSIVGNRLGVDQAPDGASGRRHDTFDVEIMDDAGNICPPGVTGEVVIRPRRHSVMFSGYWNRPEATLAQMQDLWFHTGDIGKFDEDGWFYFVDRKKDYLRRGGENISSFEMEQVFRGHPAIKDAAVHAVFSEKSEDDVKVTAVLQEDASLTEQELFAWCLPHVPHFAVPRYIEFREDLPRTEATHRVQKHKLRADGVTASTWDRVAAGVELKRR